MKRTLPLWITALGGFVLIVAYFIPQSENWGEKTAIWFDVLAGIAMILGGGNLLKVHLKKISDRPAGWGYSAITLLAFLITLVVGFGKFATPPAARQENFGQSQASLPLEQFPLEFSVPGTLPAKAAAEGLPPSARWQIGREDGRIVFRGWMDGDQKHDLIEFQHVLAWQAAIEELHEKAQPPEPLRGKAGYSVEHQVLTFQGAMSDADRLALLALGETPAWKTAVEHLYKAANRRVNVAPALVPENFNADRAAEIDPAITFTPSTSNEPARLGIIGPMSPAVRDRLRWQYPIAAPMGGPERKAFLAKLRALGPINEKQAKRLEEAVGRLWTVDQLRKAVDLAGIAEPRKKSYRKMYAEQRAGVDPIDPIEPAMPIEPATPIEPAMPVEPATPAGVDAVLSPRQTALLAEFVAAGAIDPWSIRPTIEAVQEAGPLTGAQAAAITSFFRKAPTVGQFRFELFKSLSRAGPLNEAQKEFLLVDYRDQHRWETEVGRLFLTAHTVKYRWSGTYNAPGTPFWWIYEYAFKPLTATMFAMLAFYVASAAFRAFRAKNLEASLLLGTAFIILLGRTFAGTVLTAWLPEPLAALRTENLTVTIMSVFNTAGSRAIMIGIALGIASTSLKVLLGIDRSYLGSGEQ